MQEIFEGYRGLKLKLHIWDDVDKPIAICQIIHSLSGHMAYYDEFAQRLNSNGFIVVGIDNRLCGDSIALNDFDCCSKDYFGDIVKDNLKLLDMLEIRYDLPIFIFGLCTGALAAQKCIQIASEHISGVILAGVITCGKYKAGYAANKPLGLESVNWNRKLNKQFKAEHEPMAWLSRNKDFLNTVKADKSLRCKRPKEYYKSMYTAMPDCVSEEKISTIRKSMPILLISGEQDALGGFGKKVLLVYETYVNAALTNVNMRLLKGVRHDVIHSSRKNELVHNVVEFYTAQLNLIKN